MGIWYNTVFACLAIVWTITAEEWQPTSLVQCRTNDDCQNEHHCCSVTPAFGRRSLTTRQFPSGWDGMVHYCLPWKNENATWCELKSQYNTTTPFYNGLCPCGPGLKCVPTNNLDPKYYPRDKFGQCQKESSHP